MRAFENGWSGTREAAVAAGLVSASDNDDTVHAVLREVIQSVHKQRWPETQEERQALIEELSSELRAVQDEFEAHKPVDTLL